MAMCNMVMCNMAMCYMAMCYMAMCYMAMCYMVYSLKFYCVLILHLLFGRILSPHLGGLFLFIVCLRAIIMHNCIDN